MRSEAFELDGIPCSGAEIATEHGKILLIQSGKGNLGCGYFSLAPAEKLGDRFATVTGVKCFDDMLKAEVKAVSPAASACGVVPGMTGKEALRKMR